MKYLDIISFSYPEIKSGRVIWDKHTVIVLNPNYGGKLHAVKLSVLDDDEKRRVTAFFWPKEYKSVIEKDKVLQNILKGYAPSKARSPRSFYYKFVKPLLKVVIYRTDEDIYRTYFARSVRGVSFLKPGEIIGLKEYTPPKALTQRGLVPRKPYEKPKGQSIAGLYWGDQGKKPQGKPYATPSIKRIGKIGKVGKTRRRTYHPPKINEI